MEQTATSSKFLKPLKIGLVTLDNNVVLAPMAGITDCPFRQLAREGGAGLVCGEMVSAKALVFKDSKTRKMLRVSEKERPVSLQIFGPDPATMAEAAAIVEQAGADIIDINFGCPVPKVAKSGSGAVLLSNEALISKIMEAVVNRVKAPVTAKIRIGRNSGENIAPALAGIAEKCGIAAIIIHGRAAEQGHKGNPDLEAIKKAKEACSIPVIGNGGITDEHTALNFFERTGCDGIMIGRGAAGDFGIFNRIAHFLKTGEIQAPPTWEKRIEDFKRHARLSVEFYGGDLGIIRLRKLAAYYLKGLPNAAMLRNKFCRTETLAEMDSLLGQMWDSPYFKDQND
jgi:nifR3 family TIM-barrel protein